MHACAKSTARAGINHRRKEKRTKTQARKSTSEEISITENRAGLVSVLTRELTLHKHNDHRSRQRSAFGCSVYGEGGHFAAEATRGHHASVADEEDFAMTRCICPLQKIIGSVVEELLEIIVKKESRANVQTTVKQNGKQSKRKVEQKR